MQLLKENLIELISLALVSFISGLASLTLILLLKKSFINIGENLLILMIIILSFLDFLISFSAGFYRISLIFFDPLLIDSDQTADVFSSLAFLWGLGLRLSIMIPFFFSLYIYLDIEVKIERKNTWIRFFFLMGILMGSLLWAIVPLCFDGYGMNEDMMLTIVDPILIFMSFYLPLIVIILCIIGFVLRSIYLINKHALGSSATIYVYFPLVLVVCYIVAIIRRLLNMFEIDDRSLRFAMNFLMAMQGVLNTVYCTFMTKQTKTNFIEIFACVYQNPQIEESLSENDYGHNEDLGVELN